MIPDLDLCGYFATDAASTKVQADARALDLPLPDSIFRLRRETPAQPRKGVKRRSNVSAQRSKALPSGTVIDKYRVEALLGTGGFAIVYRARHQLLGTTVALKFIKPDVLATRPGIGALLVEEARFAARIEHPNVVRIYDVSHTEELTYVVMQLVDGIPLSQHLALHGPLDIRHLLKMGMEVASGLAAGLEQGLIHRDIKPANILLSHTGCACIVDFGLARALEQDSWLSPLGSRTVVGTRGYMSPEQASGQLPVDFRSDVFSLGVTLEEAARGTSFWQHSNSVSLPAAGRLPPELLELLAWMQQPDPQARPASYQLLIDALAAAQSRLAPLSAAIDGGR